MGSGLTTEQELKIENSRQLTNVALILLPAIGVVAGLILQFRNVGNVFWWLAGASAILCAISIYLGGLGISRLRREKPSRISPFNGQAVLVTIGFLLLLSTYFSTGDDKQNNIQEQLIVISRDIGLLQGKLQTFEGEVSSISSGLMQLDSKFANSEFIVKASLDDLGRGMCEITEQVEEIQTALDKLTPAEE
ncbi:hypothetical protein [Aliidiomarina soli]|uniref:Uncharacterized protein n=1 Tax=Aliidiomarina soli TaxID=1928574 RepID=A0A432WM70_9GAMM|nr:hypothetical protein [Aliidiomarina soli]RUO34883.1 hypothetical protein CWE14_02475 [Aliidiomarina soli]